ncbi:hypothetical protein HPB50_021392 [Hyalomma asiaticum]|uniref:Uncharacterized protein n=1 Tax=Hyalomma asiaticum TaxID=266040 RepID=A0ACB7RQ77_HYAAI|nr:hypothetical protein HPB50_021392 [Hyalomma asiaticum]
MAATNLRGYDPTTLAWKAVTAQMPEDSVPRTDIVDEGLCTVVTLRKRLEQRKAVKALATDKPTSAKTPLKTSRVSWRPAAMPRISADDFTIVLKLRVTVDLKATFQLDQRGGGRGVNTVHEQTCASLKTKMKLAGKVGKTSVALLTFKSHQVPRFVHYNSVTTPVREYKCTIPACYRCGMVGHRVWLYPHPNDQRCGHCGQVVGATDEGMAPHDCKPSCLVCGEGHLTGSQACEARFRRMQQPCGHRGDRGSPQQRPTPKTQGRQRGAKNQTPKDPASGRSSLANATENVSHDSRDQGGPRLQAGEFLSLSAANGIRPPAKKISFQVGRGARVASSSHCPSPASSPKFLDLKQELAALRAQNAQLLAKIATLEAGSTPVTSSSPPPYIEITLSAQKPERMCTAPSVSEPCNTEECFQAIESDGSRNDDSRGGSSNEDPINLLPPDYRIEHTLSQNAKATDAPLSADNTAA